MPFQPFDVEPEQYDKFKIVHIGGINHPESLSIAPDGNVHTVGKKGEVYRIDLSNNKVEQYATAPNRCLGQAIDADGNLYGCDIFAGNVVRVTPDGKCSIYATGPGGKKFGAFQPIAYFRPQLGKCGLNFDIGPADSVQPGKQELAGWRTNKKMSRFEDFSIDNLGQSDRTGAVGPRTCRFKINRHEVAH